MRTRQNPAIQLFIDYTVCWNRWRLIQDTPIVLKPSRVNCASDIILIPMKSTRDIAGQLLTIGFEGQSMDAACRELLSTVRPGGLIYFQRNIADPEQFAALVSQTSEQLADTAPFLAVDLEGGTVDRFRELIARLPAAARASAAGRARDLGRVAGRELAAFGLNVDYAPVLDLALPASRDVLASRTAGGSASLVVGFAREFLSGMSETGILGCGKHFPGLGGGNLDSHLEMPCIGRNYAELWAEDLLPYRELAGILPLVMVAHAWYPELERALGWTGPSRPASLSQEIIEDLLRRRIGYQGLVLCDDLEMGGVLAGRSIGDAAVGAVQAGCDVLLVCRHVQHVQAAYEALVKECERSADFRAKVMAASDRIQRMKRNSRLGASMPAHLRPTIRELRQEIARLQEMVQQSAES